MKILAAIPRSSLVAFMFAAMLSGCKGDGFDMAPVKGKVTYQGKGLTHGKVIFTPEAGTPGPQAIGEIQPDGSFQMTTLDKSGAAVGNHKVTVHCRAELTEEQKKALMVGKLLIPEMYANDEKSPLRFEVKRGTNDCPLELKD